MKKVLIIFLLNLIFCGQALAQEYYFKNCKLSNIATGNYIINIDKKVIEATLTTTDGRVQQFSDKIKTIEKERIISEKIPSGLGDQIYFEYYLNLKSKQVIKLQYKRQGESEIKVYKIQSKKESECAEVKGGWNKLEIEKSEANKEQKQILKAQKKMKEEQNTVKKCKGSNYKKWNNCKGLFKTETGDKYDGIFINGTIIKGTAFFSGGSKYVGEFKDLKPHGYGNFAWENGDRYYGQWENGKNNGTGTKIWRDGREYSGKFMNDKLHGDGTFYYPDGKKYVGEFVNGKRHGQGTLTYADGTAYIGKFIAGVQQGLGECVAVDGSSTPCVDKKETQAKNFTGKNTLNISIVAKKWVRVSQYEANSKKGKKVMNKLKEDFEVKASELCSSTGKYKVLDKKIEVLDVDETPAYGLETKLQLGITGVIECI